MDQEDEALSEGGGTEPEVFCRQPLPPPPCPQGAALPEGSSGGNPGLMGAPGSQDHLGQSPPHQARSSYPFLPENPVNLTCLGPKGLPHHEG